MTLEPEDADWIWIKFDIEPFDAGRVCCYSKTQKNFYYGFQCRRSYQGDVTFTTIVSQRSGPDAQKSVSLTCD